MRVPILPAPPRDEDGLPVVSALEHRLAHALLIVATVWFGLAAAWEMFGPLLAGHYAASASVGIVADNMLRWNIAGPVWQYTATEPSPAQYYCHHPWGIFWTNAALMRLFGQHDFVCRLPAVILSSLTPPLLYLLGRALWRPAAGAITAVAFTVLPITLAFANFNALEVPVIAWSSLTLWAYVRHTQTGRKTYLRWGLLGTVMALNADWPAFVLVGAMLLLGLIRGILARQAWGRVPLRPHARWWALTALCMGATGLLYLFLFSRSNKLDDLLNAYRARSQGQNLALSETLAARRYWIELSFTPIAIVLGKATAVLSGVRTVWRRELHEALPLAVLLMATVQYVAFKQGADIHIYWPHYFALFFALGMGLFTDTLVAILNVATRHHRSAWNSPKLLLSALSLSLLPLIFILRDAIPALVYARQTGGRFNEKGALIHSDGDKIAFLRWLEPQLSARSTISLHEGMKPDWSQHWSLRQRVTRKRRGVPAHGNGRDVFIADTRFLLDPLQAKLAASHRVTAIGPFWFTHRDQSPAPIDAYRFIEQPPTWSSRYFVSGTEPRYSIVPAPYQSWELRRHFGQTATLPTTPPHGMEELRIAHNIAVDQGDMPLAARYRAKLLEKLNPPVMPYDDGTTLLGVKYAAGARNTLTLVFHGTHRAEHDVQPQIWSRVVAPPRWSTTMVDPTERTVGPPLGLAPLRWRPGFIYSHRIAIRQRPGTEVFTLAFHQRGPPNPLNTVPRPVRGTPRVEVLRLP